MPVAPVRVPVVVGVKPVPVKVTVVPYPALVAIAAGEEEVTAGPAMLKAFASEALSAPWLETHTLTPPSLAPVVTATGAVIEVPVLEVVALKCRSAASASEDPSCEY
jgi:hypothetical protein